MDGVPDHNTLCRAFGVVARLGGLNRMLDLQARWAAKCRMIQSPAKPAAMDSSMFESRHVSRHFEKRCRETARRHAKHKRRKNGQKDSKKQGDRRRSRTIKRLPKLSLAVASLSHLILAARATTGGGPDYEHFEPLLLDAWRRANVRKGVAGAGFVTE